VTTHDSGFRSEVDENCALLGHYAANSVSILPTFRDNLSGPIFRGQESKRKPVVTLGRGLYREGCGREYVLSSVVAAGTRLLRLGQGVRNIPKECSSRWSWR